MAQRVGRLQQENAKLRDEIKRLKGALKDISTEIVQEAPILKPKREKSPLSKERKSELRDEIDNRLNYVIPTKPVLKQKALNVVENPKFSEPEVFVASFGQEDDKKYMADTKKTPNIGLNELGSINSSPKNDNPPLDPQDFSLEATSSIDDIQGSPDFDPPIKPVEQKIEPRTLKESFSSFYNDESVNKTLNDRSFEDISNSQTVENEKKIFSQEVSHIKKEETGKKFISDGVKNDNERSIQVVSQNFNEKNLVSEIEALRRENTQLRMKLTGGNKKNHVSAKLLPSDRPYNWINKNIDYDNKERITRNLQIRTRSKTKSKSPNRKCKSRSITPRDLSSRPMRRNISNKSLVSDLTPRRSKHCNTCDHLLSKGYSTIYCGKHGTAKLPKQ
ncbi:hypothetical protein SteCoe_15861 [Stentor coeruleus]|uniref:Uncharacterized protein n=1 Tax=Stentor coeruleus TaxID=5963 RepID=A0A1R2C2R2_9CILI|nr:hypothetical protein SteCoe_15861 [Stentor coeruleus]